MAKIKSELDPWAEEYLESKDIAISNPSKMFGRWNNDAFHKEQPIWIELGSGKGTFIVRQAEINPDINFIGIEPSASLQVVGVQNAINKYLENILFILGDFTKITKWFEEESLDRIFINFPDPWPGAIHTERRLLFHTFLTDYYKILKFGGHIQFRTDQLSLFEFVIEEIEQRTKFKIKNINMDLNNTVSGLVQTDYENKHATLTNKILYLELHK